MVEARGKFECTVFLLLICTFPSLTIADVNGGTTCATCTVLMAFVEQTAAIHNESLIHALDRLCGLLPDTYRSACKDFADFIGPILLPLITKDDNADTICHKLDLCYTESGKQECHLFPKKQMVSMLDVQQNRHRDVLGLNRKKLLSVHQMSMKGIKADICDLPGIKEICNWINEIFSDHDPAVDVDGDRFSPYQTLRGSSWRGKDCDDESREAHPGAKPLNSDRTSDSNCNGIMGVDPATSTAYEDMLCGGTEPRGVVVLGDSISAHFHLPREWFNTSEMSVEVFEPAPYIVENEIDWPAFSAVTGYMNATDTLKNVIHGATDSIYLKMWERNRCNFRDFQNIAVNGARSDKMVDIEKSLFRNRTTDYPLVIFYALVGNDVCNGHPDTFAHMTTPEEMRENVEKTLLFLETHIPAGSYVMFSGLADGRVLYNALHNRTHPIGSLRKDVTYADFYDYFNCLQVSPCTGWMNTNETVRNLTTERAQELSAVLKDLAEKNKSTFKNFQLYYAENPINQVIDSYAKKGGNVWDLLEPVDGFHANQNAQPLIADAVWSNLETMYPEIIGKENPNNNKIHQLFGDQGGYI